MKKIYLSITTLLFIITVASCKKDAASTDIKSVKVKNSSVQNTQQGQLAAKIAGNYVSDTYLSEIEKQKSIYNVEGYTTTVLGFELNKDSLAGKHPFLNGYSFNEGGINTPLLYNNTKNQFENNTALSAEISAFTTPFVIKPLGITQLEIDFEKPAKKEVYRKVTDIDTELRHILFEGRYIDKATNTQVKFDKNGKLDGIDGKHFYELLYSFDGMDFDVVFISDNNQQKYQDMYHFKIDGNTLKIFKVEENEEDGNTIGAQLYEFVKQ